MTILAPIFGILGGAGPLIAARFQYEFLSRFQHQFGVVEDCDFPAVVSINQALRGVDSSGIASHELAKISLKEHSNRAQKAGANRMVIICGSLHSVWEPEPHLDWVNWIAHTSSMFRKNGQQRIGIVGSTSSLKDQIFAHALQEQGLTPVVLDERHQQLANQLIEWGMGGYMPPEAEEAVIKLNHYFEMQKTDSIWWECTELSFIPKSWLLPHSVQSLDQIIQACFISLQQDLP